MTTTEGPTAEETDAHVLPPEEVDRLLGKAPWKRFAVIGDSLAEGLGESSPATRTRPGRSGSWRRCAGSIPVWST